MNKFKQAEYLVNLLAIMDSKEQAGLQRGKALGKEYDKAYTEFIDTLHQEHQNETGIGTKLDGSDEGRAPLTGDLPKSNSEDRRGSAGRADR